VAELEKLTANIKQVYDEYAEPAMTRTTAYFRSEAEPILNPCDIAQKLNEANAKVMKRLDEFTNLGSGWRLSRSETLDLGVVQYRPFRRQRYIKTPTYIQPRTVINVKNNDTRCFEWAILSALFPKQRGQHPDRPASYQAHPQFSAHVYCAQTSGWIEMPLGTEVGLGPGYIVLDGDLAHPKGAQPQFWAHVRCGQTPGWITMPLGTEMGLGPRNIV